MKRVLTEETAYPFLNMPTTQRLQEARQNFVNSHLNVQDTVVSLAGVEWFPWRGSHVLRTLELCAKADRLKTERNDLSIRYQSISAADFASHLARIASGAFAAEELVMLVADLKRDRFDEYVPEPLLQSAFVAEVLDVPGAQMAAELAQSEMTKIAGGLGIGGLGL